MPPKRNPLNLNALQLKTLTLLQEVARINGQPVPEGEAAGTAITKLPPAHGDHFHLGNSVVSGRDATGLYNPSVWKALERKGLVRQNLPDSMILTPAGRDYDTGLRDHILHSAPHRAEH